MGIPAFIRILYLLADRDGIVTVALSLLALGVVKGIYDQVVHPLYFAINTILIIVSGLIIATLGLLADLIVRSRGDY